jgi:hypothetical protein
MAMFPGTYAGWGVHHNNVSNLERAVYDRVLTCKGNELPQPKIDVRRALMKFKQLFLHHMPHVNRISTEEFVESYTGRKRKMYERVSSDLKMKPFDEKDSYISPFIKDEKIDFYADRDKTPRVIQPRSPRFNVEVGVYIKPFEKAAFHAVAGVFRGVTIVKGLNSVQRASVLNNAWRTFDNPVALVVDAVRFDAHCNSALQDWTYEVEETVFPELKPFNKLRRRNRAYARTHDGLVKYTVYGRLMSGDMDTACGGALKMTAVTWTVMRGIGVKYKYINDGDDGVIMIEAQDVDMVRKHFVRLFLDFGIQMKWEGSTSVFEEIEFCNTRPVFDGSMWRMIRVPHVAMAKDSLTLRNPKTPEAVNALRNANGWCGLSLAGNMPVYWRYYWRMVCGNRPETELTEGKHYLANGLEPVHARPTHEARLSFFRAFKITPENQVALEYYYETLNISDENPIPQDVLREKPELRILTTECIETRVL